MKYLVLLCDGLADRPIKELNGRTIIQAANIPNIHALAAKGSCGFIKTTPDGMAPGSDICNLSVFGYDPRKYYTGRSPLEAMSMGIKLNDNDMAFRCNTVTIKNDIMESFTAHHISKEHVSNIIDALNREFSGEGIEFYKGVGYRNLMVIRNADMELDTTPPHDITDKNVRAYLPQGKGAEKINEIMLRASDKVFNGKTDMGKATNIWLWGEGRRPALPSFKSEYRLNAAVISAVDLINGIGVCAGMDIIKVPNITGFTDTNFAGKAEYGINALKNHDYVFIHLEAPDEAGHLGSISEKIKAAELIDSIMLPVITDGIKEFGEYRILITPDHATPIELKTHSDEKIPAVLYGTGIDADSNKLYGENIIPSFDLDDGYKIAELLIKH
ncbi:MAG: cofactor-independent phosphoglycerate mutase [Mucispirillum sp.]|nr:cofactor-independent phosphoglycerate mutase [Mucispirillum sp.]